MAFAIPSLSDLVQRARAAFRAYMPGTDAWIWPNNVYVTAKVIGGSNEEVFGRLDCVRKQAFVLTADGEWLDMWGSQYGMARLPATTASGTAVLTASDALVIPAGTLLSLSDGTGYLATSDVALAAAGQVNVPVLALAAGKDGLAQPGATLTIGAGPSGAQPSGAGAGLATAIVGPAGFTGGADSEKDDPLRRRILFRLQNPPRGGSPPDYVDWCLAGPGVTRVFVERLWNGPGTLRLFPVFDDLFPTTGGVADTAHVQTVIAALAPLVPSGADVAVTAPNQYPIPIVIANMQPLSTSVQQAVSAELADTFRRLGSVAGNDTPVLALPFLATPQSFSRDWIWQAIANATGVERFILVSPAADVPIPAAAIPVLGAISYVKQ